MRRHSANLTGLLSGLLFIGIGVYALAVGPNRLGDALRWVWPIMLLGLGVALLAGSPRQNRSRHEVGSERSEDGEVEQTSRGHDGGVSTFL
jgi:hypothetical protein